MTRSQHPPLPPGRLEGLRALSNEFGEGRLADALLAKWLADPDAEDKWARLHLAVEGEQVELREAA